MFKRPKTRTSSASTPAPENSVNVQIGEPEENKLARSLKRAGQMAAIMGGSGLAGAGIGSMMFEADEASKPVYNRRLTEAQHAVDNARGYDEAPEDFAIYEGIRQGLIGGAIQPMDVNRMIIEGRLSPRAELLISDIHDASGVELDTDPRQTAQYIAEAGGDAASYLYEQQALRQQLGIDVPV